MRELGYSSHVVSPFMLHVIVGYNYVTYQRRMRGNQDRPTLSQTEAIKRLLVASAPQCGVPTTSKSGQRTQQQLPHDSFLTGSIHNDHGGLGNTIKLHLLG